MSSFRCAKLPVDVMTCKEVAKYLRVSEYTIRDLCRRKVIPHFKVGTLLRFDRQDVMDWKHKQIRRSVR